ncbi:MAG: hypothetical protein RJA09_318 [Pseudomonadota bacterium]
MTLPPFSRPGLLAAAGLLALGLHATTQAQPSNWKEPDNWQELEQAPPVGFNPQDVVPFEITVYSSLQFGVVPATVTLGTDGVVRYVLVARSATAQTVLYEGLRCSTRQTKTYARWSSDSGAAGGTWQTMAGADWRPVTEGNASRPAWTLAKLAFCDGATPNGDARRMLRELRYGRPTTN